MNKYSYERNRAMNEIQLMELADLYKLVSDYTRVRILTVLAKGELSVNEIAENLNMSQSAISHQLRLLKSGKLVKNHREGKQIIYQLDDDHVKTIIEVGMEHVLETYK